MMELCGCSRRMRITTVFCCVFYTILIDLNTNYALANQNLGPSNQSEAYFNGSSYIRLHTTISLKNQNGLSFKTCLGGSLFSQQQNGDQIELSVGMEGVLFSGKTAGKEYGDQIAGNFLDNRWHSVFMQYSLGNLTITVDGDSHLIANSSYQNALLTSANLYNEGAAVLLIGKQFNGCILEGPSLVFDPNIIMSNHNVIFEPCPIPSNSCTPRENTVQHNYCMIEPCMRQGTCINGRTAYSCTCLPRYTGKNCEIDMGDPCEKNPNLCKNSGACKSNISGEYTCVCPPGYTGSHCEYKIILHPLCKIDPCLNGGTCDVDLDNNLICLCSAGFNGSNCEHNVDECHPNPCLNQGMCVDGLNNFTCDCSGTGYQGALCDDNINECLIGNPCLNRGVCFDTYGSYLCQCANGYGGQNCQFNIDECISKPCLNHGVCVDRAGGYTCHCAPRFTGDNCELETNQNECDSESCSAFADCRDIGNALACVCKPEFPGVYPNCSVNTVCANNPCKNGGVCSAVNGFFNCSCLPGYAGKVCQIKIDECASMPCQNGGVCTDQINGFVCNCTEQWMGAVCELPYDACEMKPCENNATCTIGANKHDFTCNCLSGFTGEHCEININDCVDNKCPPAMTCVDMVNSYECRCPAGYTGENCSLDLDPCTKEPCSNGATCEVDHNTHTFTCRCPPGFSGLSCTEDLDECKLLDPPICNHGICVNNKGSFQCYCMPGYTGERCNLDFNECLSTPCRNNATCVNKVNNYECRCPLGYEGKDCSINIDECAIMPCAEGSTCIDGINEFTCNCQPGLTGKLCDININDCEPNPCQNEAHCIDGLNSYSCNCNDTGYEGEHCEINIDDCKGNPCFNGADCEDLVKDYECKCFKGYNGKNCENDINECESSPCQYGGTCLEKSNMTLYHPSIVVKLNISLPETFDKPFDYADADGYECLCVPGVTGPNCAVNINECESSPCFNGKCIDNIGSYFCECDDGYEGERCDIDIDECEKYNPCVHGYCLDKTANYYCDCEENYGGKNCSVELIGCIGNPCLNEGNCVPYLVNETEHKFNCSCPNGFHGSTCEKVSTMSLSGNSLISVNTTRDEGYDIQFRFKTTLGDGLLALGKGLTYYILELSRGRLNLHSSLLNKWEGVFIGSNLNDSQWQRVFVAINSTHLVLSANDEQTIYPITFNENYNVSSTSFPLTYIGGIPSNLRKLTHGQPFLVGCTEDVLINGEWVLPQNQNASWMHFQNVEVGCLREPQCNPNPCHSGGHCTDRWRDFSCSCERPYLGHTCQYNYTAATFGYENITDSLVTISVADYARRAVRTIVDISMFIRTRQSRGQIFYLGSPIGSSNNNIDETYIAALLESGELLVRIQFNGSLEAYTVGGVKLDNGYNHLIQVIRNVTLVQVKLNGTEYFRKTISAAGSLDAQVLFLGGLPQLRPVRQATETMNKIIEVAPAPPTAPAAITASNINFKGIIQDVQISNGSSIMVAEFYPLQAQDIEIPIQFGEVTFDKSLVFEGVLSDDSCKVNPCHTGICENTWNDYRCNCTRGFKGKDCTELEFCELEECPAGSVCKNLEDGYECIANSTFNGKSDPLQYGLTILPNSSKSISFDTIELTYRTRSWGTILFAKHKENYFVIFIYHNEVVIEWSFAGVNDTRRFRKDRFEAQWLTLYFKIKESSLTGGFKENVMDEMPNFEVNDFDYQTFADIIRNGSIYIAGSDNKTFNFHSAIENTDYNSTGYIPVSDTTTAMTLLSNSLDGADFNEDVFLHKVDQNKKTDRFKGCLSEIRIGGLLLPFFTTKHLYPKNRYSEEFFELLPDTVVETGCTLCYNEDCFNKGFCINPHETYKCNCTEGYTADDCSIDINECEYNQCQNNATCVDLVARYECTCLNGYEGEHCEFDINECLSNPCRNGGTCIDKIGTFKCDCPEDYVGKQCEAPLLITCDNQPCKDGATCKTGPNELTGNNFTCICTEGMEGPLCDTPFCLRQHCEQGHCNTTNEVPYCQCQRGFEGKFCEVDINECILPTGGSPCQNGGTCIDGIYRYDCNCTGTGFTGLLCEMDIDECKMNKMPCGFNGRCENLPGTFRCTCDAMGKCGTHCTLDDLCVTEKPCEHGDCTSLCTEQSDYICKCNEGYTGKNCSELNVAASKSDGGLNILYIVIPVLFVILLAFAIGLAVLVNVARSKRATRGTYSPSAQEFCNPRVELDHVLKPPPEERLI